jgi:uncharacterized protein YndB with AHSA1/START domain
LVVKEAGMAVSREIDIDASPAEVWEALATEQGRERWLQEPQREIEVEVMDAPHRLVWWWSTDEEPPTRVEFLLVPAVAGTRIVVTESVPSFPIAMLAASFELVAA